MMGNEGHISPMAGMQVTFNTFYAFLTYYTFYTLYLTFLDALASLEMDLRGNTFHKIADYEIFRL